MRAVVQRVSKSRVMVDTEVVGAIDRGLLVLLGVAMDDDETDADAMADKLAGLRCFEDAEGKINLSVEDINGSLLIISQFTLLADCRKGRRPSLNGAARPDVAIPLYESVVNRLRRRGLHVETGEFGAHMDVHLVNDGPVTLLLDTKRLF